MDPSGTPYVLTLSCSLSTSLPTTNQPLNADVLQELPESSGGALQWGTPYPEASTTRKGSSTDFKGGASPHPLRLSGGAGGLIVESFLTITSPTKGNQSFSPTKVLHAPAPAASRNVIPNDPASEEVARKALRKHRKRLAKIVVDQWIYAARHRLLTTRLRKLRNDQLLKACLEKWRKFRSTKQIEKRAKELRVHAIRRRSFREWIAFLHQQHERKKMEVDVVRKLCRNKLRAAWNSWTTFLKRNASNFLEDIQPEDDEKDEEEEEDLLEAAFTGWKTGSIAMSMVQGQPQFTIGSSSSGSLDSVSNFHLASLLSRAFQKWTKYISSIKMANERDHLARSHYCSRNIRKVFTGVRRLRGRRGVKLAHMKLAEDHWKFQELRRRLQIWHGACGYLYARRSLKKQAATKRERWLMSAVLQAWIDYTSAKSRRRARGRALQDNFLTLIMKKVWKSWMSIRDVIKLERMNRELAHHLFVASRSRAAFHAWLEFFENRKQMARNREKAASFSRKRLAKLALMALKQYRLLKMNQRAARTDAMLHRNSTLERRALRAWKDWLAKGHERQKEMQDALAVYSNLLQRWACERILTYGIREQSLKLNRWLETQAARLVASLSKVAPFARKWTSRVKKRPNGAGSRSIGAGKKPALELPMVEATEMHKSVDEDETPEKRSPAAAPSLMDMRPLPRPAARRPSYLAGH